MPIRWIYWVMLLRDIFFWCKYERKMMVVWGIQDRVFGPIFFWTDQILTLNPGLVRWVWDVETLSGWWLEHNWIMTFHSVGKNKFPTDFHIFQRGRAQPPTSLWFLPLNVNSQDVFSCTMTALHRYNMRNFPHVYKQMPMFSEQDTRRWEGDIFFKITSNIQTICIYI